MDILPEYSEPILPVYCVNVQENSENLGPYNFQKIDYIKIYKICCIFIAISLLIISVYFSTENYSSKEINISVIMCIWQLYCSILFTIRILYYDNIFLTFLLLILYIILTIISVIYTFYNIYVLNNILPLFITSNILSICIILYIIYIIIYIVIANLNLIIFKK